LIDDSMQDSRSAGIEADLSRVSHSPGIYVHVPFCRTKCSYCDFYSVTGSLPERRFFGAIKAESSMRRSEVPGPAGSLYLGGGTPSVADPAAAARVPGIISDAVGLEEGAEVTIEVNPDDVTRGGLEAYIAGGFNRISIGVQSFNDRELSFLGRRHDSTRASEAVETAIVCGFERIGIDLMFGLAGQTPEDWRSDLDRALEYGPHHISCYQLTIEGNTPLSRRRDSGGAVCADEEILRVMFLEASKVLTEGGYIHYEVSNFASGQDNLSRHNVRYWLRKEYLGLGPSAHTFDGRSRRWNHRSVGDWLECVEAGELPVAGEEELDPEQVRAELLMLGFRTMMGVETGLLREHPDWEANLDYLIECGLAHSTGDRIIPTAEGLLMADRIPLLFI
jgi:putative oxygen-independent coproporphyrinogen III oxidase